MNTRQHLLLLILGLLLVAQPRGAEALQFWPTDAEFASWPEYCQAKYGRTSVGQNSSFASAIPPETIDKWANDLGRAWVFVHHHCAGLIWLQRAKLAQSSHDRKEALRHALGESRFTLDRIPNTHPLYAEILTHMGTVERAGGNAEAAMRYFSNAMKNRPDFAGGYQGASLILQDQGKYGEARDILLEGDKATGGESAEIQYFLGLTYVKLKDFDQARTAASRAYELGYPLPGLRNQLAAAGHPLE